MSAALLRDIAAPDAADGLPMSAMVGVVLLLAMLLGAGAMTVRDYRAGRVALLDANAAFETAASSETVAGFASGAGVGLQERREALRRVVAKDSANGRAWALLGFADGEAGDFARAAEAFEKALAHSRKIALDPWVWCEYADVLGMAQGTLAGRPTEALAKALELQHDHPKALEMAGSAAYERRDFAAAAHYWQRLLPQLAAGSPPQQAVSAAIARAERQAAVALPNSR
jgi:cytochrome c-type biogenesis protein CcmH